MYESWSNKFIIIDYFLLRMKVKCMAYLITQTIAIRAICKGELQLQITSILSQRQKKQQQHEVVQVAQNTCIQMKSQGSYTAQ